jgi:hypothetical protein
LAARYQEDSNNQFNPATIFVSVSSQTFFTITFEIGDLTAEFFVLLWFYIFEPLLFNVDI